MNDIFEYYKLELTAKSPVFIGSGQSIGKKEFCLLTKTDTIRFMDMEKLINYFAKENTENLELFEKFLIEDPSIAKKQRRGKDGTLYTGEECLSKKWLHTFLNLIGMPVSKRKECALYEIENHGMFQDDKTPCDINCFMRGSDGKAYIPGSSVKGMLRTALFQQLIRKNPDRLPEETFINKEERNLTEKLINTLELKYKKGSPDANDAVNSIMIGIIISDSEAIPNECMTVCKKIDRTSSRSGGEEKTLNVARECIKPYTKAIFHVKVDNRYFRPVGIKMSFPDLFSEMIKAFDEEYRKFYLSKFAEVEGNKIDFEHDFLVLGGGSGYFGKNIIYTRFGFNSGLRKVSEYMRAKDLDKYGRPKDKDGKMKNPDDYNIHGISPHMLKLTMYNNELYHMGICDVELKKEEIE